jgi:chromosome segregation ATPase
MQARASARDAEVDTTAVRAEKKAALASVEKAQQEVAKYQEQIQELETRLSTAEAQKEELQESMNAASGGNDHAQDRISELQDQLSVAKTEADEASVALKKKAKEKIQAAQQEAAALEAQVNLYPSCA